MTAEGISDKPYLPYTGMMLNKTAMTAAHTMLSDAKKAVGGKAVTVDAAYNRIVYGGNESEAYKSGLVIFLSDNSSESGAYVALGQDYKSWLNANAAKYGFINDFEDAYRYVGEVHAKYISENEITLADYIEFLKKNTNAEKAITVKLGDAEYSVYYAAGNAGDTVKVPAEAQYTVSGTNEGGVIITVKTK
jgi:D-alanyl-D-alanine carboxypeptidase